MRCVHGLGYDRDAGSEFELADCLEGLLEGEAGPVGERDVGGDLAVGEGDGDDVAGCDLGSGGGIGGDYEVGFQ